MSRVKDNPNIHDRRICYSEKEILAPMEVIKDLFADYRLIELRNIQEHVMRICLTTDEGAFTEGGARSYLLSYNEKLIRLLEAAFYLKDSLVPLANEIKTEVLPKETSPVGSFDMQVSNLAKGIDDVSADLAHLWVIVVNAWTTKICSELKIATTNMAKTGQTAPLPWVDLDKVRTMALKLQTKLAKLAGIAVDILIAEMKVHYINKKI